MRVIEQHGDTSGRRSIRVAGVAVLLLLSLSCVHDDPGPGPLSGPSELGLSLTLTATPDMLPLDGTAQARLEIVARDENGGTVANIRLALQIRTSRGFEDFGRLSARSVTTGSDGRAVATYTVPASAVSPARTADPGTTIDIWVTPIDGDFSNAIARSVTIRLIPPGTVIPPFNVAAGFAFTPATPTVFDQVRFTTGCDTPTSTDCVQDPSGLVTRYRWDFGDGRTATGSSTTHVFAVPGTYVVRLTVSDQFNRSVQTTRTVVIAPGTAPTAVIAVSPTSPEPEDTVFFNAGGSTAAPGRRLVSYDWDFGDGGTASGVTASHRYRIEGDFVVTLTVTDDRGQVGTTTATVKVEAVGPMAEFVFSPEEPKPGDTVFFDASASEGGNGRRIVSYDWNFGDGATGTGVRPSHAYDEEGTYVVTLTVTNDFHETHTVDDSVPVKEPEMMGP